MNMITMMIISFLVLSIFGTLLHFTHLWFKRGVLLHMFSALNESTWEHMKLLVAPTILVGVLQKIIWDDLYSNILSGVLGLFIIELLSIPILFEIFKRIMKKVPFWITISIFYISIILGLITEYLILKNEYAFINEIFSEVVILLITICFAIFSYFPPKISLFKDPVTKRWGDTKK